MKIARDKLPSGKMDTYIGEETSFEGDLVSKENIRIYGSVKGKVECQGRVVIGETGNVEADITANDVVVNGKVIGNITARGVLEMASTGVIKGDIKTSRLIMADGGKFDGHSEMMADGKSVPPEKNKAKDKPPATESKEKP